MESNMLGLVIDLRGQTDPTQEKIEKNVDVDKKGIFERYKLSRDIGSKTEYLEIAEKHLYPYNKIIKDWGFKTFSGIEEMLSSGITTDAHISNQIEEYVASGKATEPKMYSCTTGTTGRPKRFPVEIMADVYATDMGVFFLNAGLETDRDFGLVLGYAPSPDPKFKHSSEVVTRSVIAGLGPKKAMIVPYGQVSVGLQNSTFREMFIDVLREGGGLALLPPDLMGVVMIAKKDGELKETLQNVTIAAGAMHLEANQQKMLEGILGEPAKHIHNIYGSTSGLCTSGNVKESGMTLTPWRVGAVLTEKGKLVPAHEAEPGTRGWFCVNGPFPLHTCEDIVETVSPEPVPLISHSIGKAAQKMKKKVNLEGVRGEQPWIGARIVLSHVLPSDDVMKSVLHGAGVDAGRTYGVLTISENDRETAVIYMSQEDYVSFGEKFDPILNALSQNPYTKDFYESMYQLGVGELKFESMGDEDNPRREIMKLFWLATDDYAERHRLSKFTLDEILRKHPELLPQKDL